MCPLSTLQLGLGGHERKDLYAWFSAVWRLIIDLVFGVCVPFPFDVLGRMWNSIIQITGYEFSYFPFGF